jgi:hypothetical protein
LKSWLKGSSLLGFLRELQAHKGTTSEAVKLSGREVVPYQLVDDIRVVTVWLDPKTKLPVRQESEMTNPYGKWLKFVVTGYERDPEVKDAEKFFGTDAPEGYTVRDVTDEPDTKKDSR